MSFSEPNPEKSEKKFRKLAVFLFFSLSPQSSPLLTPYELLGYYSIYVAVSYYQIYDSFVGRSE